MDVKLRFLPTSNMSFAGYTGSKNQVRNSPEMEFVEIQFSKSIFQKSAANQQEKGFMRLKTRYVYDNIFVY